ncbi:hypothetical protein V4303_24910 [Klebsiella pneumoniae]|uniref:hypothetical protein n=1 Tax=Klebsiella pneumoniae complex TaxID=3390273 RepID=UPI000BDA898E|nr:MULTISPECIES: hypothetical protein [Klebsiella]EIY5001945.1 hypothetical protein [Klebsiella quasipneumoniae]MCI8136818.1 hypothetical protein [Klebsiella pneumoniae]MCI8239167.1 hypothetical protein [Klebsiella pneumoniae]MDD1916715.1 hypothetical protein [Klebsiella pneumoniae]MDD1926836.1 hypothetical protein [Klebsiella pneumoniae]
MEIDLDNLVFSGLDEAEERNAERLEEAEERNAERLEEADKKAQAIVADDDCGDACKI